MLLKLSSDLALKQKAIILSKLINGHAIHCTGMVRVLFSLHNPKRVQVYSTWTSPPSVTESRLSWVSFPNYVELAKVLNPAFWLTAAW